MRIFLKKENLISVLIFLNCVLIVIVGILLFKTRQESSSTSKPDYSVNHTKISLLDNAVAEPSKSVQGSTSQRTEFVEASEKASPAVVFIGAKRTAYVSQMDPFFNDFFSDFFNPYGQPRVERISSLGTGFIIDKEGNVLTNFHVIDGADEITVSLPDGREFKAKVVDADKMLDIALLKIDGKNLPFLEMGDSDNLLIGEWAIAIGNPFGNMMEDTRPSITVGVISALHRSFTPHTEPYRVYQDMIQTDAAINPGNSGGPLINLKGEIVGINTFIFTKDGGSNGIGFAIPINKAKTLVKEIEKYGKVRTGWYGFAVQNLTPNLVAALGVDSTQGAIVNYVERNSPAEKAGLRIYDIITQVGDKKIKNQDDLAVQFYSMRVGDSVSIKIIRDKRTITLQYTLEEYKKNF